MGEDHGYEEYVSECRSTLLNLLYLAFYSCWKLNWLWCSSGVCIAATIIAKSPHPEVEKW